VGDDDLLARMHRGYTVAEYRTIVTKLRGAIPEIAITTDVMLGFPGETDEQYWSTMRLVEDLRFDSAFMFAYSPRPGTKAAEMPDQVPHEIKIERLSRLVEMQNKITVEINRALVGRTYEVLVEGRSHKDASKLTGWTSTFKTVNFSAPNSATRSADSLIGKIVGIQAIEGHLWGFTGALRD
jgi:tRNA-2-methylthio-N6-dimethylallyladenosine synthase